MTSVSPLASKSLSISNRTVEPDALSYCQAHGLSRYLELAIEMAVRHFLPAEPIRVELDIDPETDEEKLLLLVTVVASLEDALARDAAYGREWVQAVPPDVMLQISLLFNIPDCT